MSNPIFKKSRIINMSYLAFLLLLTVYGFKLIEATDAYQPSQNNSDLIPYKENGTINLLLEYNGGSPYDVENDGVEGLLEVIDFSISNTTFNGYIDKSKLCTRWEVYSIDNEESTQLCYGNQNCCEFAGIASSRSKWDDVFYLTYGMYGASVNNLVSAQVVYADYNLSIESHYADIYSSAWQSLPAVFLDYAPHFSLVIVGMYNNTANLTITSPDNSSSLQNGEGIYLNITINETANIDYSLDYQSIVELGSGKYFSKILNGTLAYGVLGNGNHNLTIYAKNSLANISIINYSFSVNDAAAPKVYVNITNNSAVNGASIALSINVSSDEFAYITYRINNENPSNLIDLGIGKSRIILLNVSNGQNNLTINAFDMQNNSNTNHFSFNFVLVQTPSCSDASQNGDETGIDCGGVCMPCIVFSVGTDKTAYNSTEPIFVTVIARAYSSVNLTVTRQNTVTYRHTFVPVFQGSPISEIRVLSNASNPGNYTINAEMHYLNISESKNATFEVLSPSTNILAVAINANTTSINEGEIISFKSTVSGNISAVLYKWDFQNDGITDSSSAEPSYLYTTNGTFIVNLTVSDSKLNQTGIEVINVRKLYNLTIFIKNNLTNNAVENAEVTLEDESKNTTIEGKVNYLVPRGTYNLAIKKHGFISFSNRTEIDNNALIEVSMLEEDNSAPLIQIISTGDEKALSNNSISLKYRAIDSSPITCRVFVFTDSSLWYVAYTDTNVISNEESHFTLNGLKNGTYQWKIECIDKNGNSNISDAYTFTYDSSLVENELNVDLNSQDKDTEDIISQINLIESDLDNIDSDEKEAAEAMQLKNLLEKAKVEVQRANRDLHSLKWRKLNASDLEQETNKILERVKDIKDTTPKKLQIVEKNEFIKYPSKEDVSEALKFFINLTNLKFSKKQLNGLVEDNHKLQSALTVTTKAKIIDVEYLSSDKKTVTLIQKAISTNRDLDDTLFYEVFPKDIAKNLSDIELLFEYEVVDYDPIIKIDTKKIKEFSYYLNKKVNINDVEKIKSIILNKNLKPAAKNSVTGLVSFNALSSDWVKTTDTRLVIEVAIIISLLAVFLYFQFSGSLKNMSAFDKKTKEKLKEFGYLIEKIAGYLEQNKYNEAKVLYKEAESIFRELPKNAKASIYAKISNIQSKMDFVYIDSQLNEAFEHLNSSQKEKALAIYSTISNMYKNLQKDYKSKIHLKCMELHKKLHL